MRTDSKYKIVYKNENGDVEVVGECNRRLKNLSRRGMRGRPETIGSLWLVETKLFEKGAYQLIR